MLIASSFSGKRTHMPGLRLSQYTDLAFATGFDGFGDGVAGGLVADGDGVAGGLVADGDGNAALEVVDAVGAVACSPAPPHAVRDSAAQVRTKAWFAPFIFSL
jgi:hypothetical protein